jgi:hypothetical protein
MYFIYIAQLMAPVSEGGISLDTPPPLVMTPTTWDFAGSKPPLSPPAGKKKKKKKGKKERGEREREREIAMRGYLSRRPPIARRPRPVPSSARDEASQARGDARRRGEKDFFSSRL